jgi:hypothetical protein
MLIVVIHIYENSFLLFVFSKGNIRKGCAREEDFVDAFTILRFEIKLTSPG